MIQCPQVSKDDLPPLAMQYNDEGIRLEFAGHVSDLAPQIEQFDRNLSATAEHESHGQSSKSDRDDETTSKKLEYSLSKAWAQSGYPLGQVQCHAEHRRVTLTGSVSRYFHVQVAIEMARRVCRQCRIETQIKVDSPKTKGIVTESTHEKSDSPSAPLFRVA